MIIGITGSRNGMTSKAQNFLKRYISDNEINELHHGDCVGADSICHRIAVNQDIKIIVHPPKNKKMRAFCDGCVIMEEFDYLTRNRNIVNSVDTMIAFPKSKIKENRSGTWYTINYAKKCNKPLIVVYPNGDVQEYQNKN